MALVEALNFVITADTAKAQADIKALSAASKELASLEVAAKRLEAGASKSAEGLAKFNAATAAVTQAKSRVESLAGAAQQGLSPIQKLSGAFASGLGIGTGIGLITQGVGLVKELGAALLEASKLAEQDARSQFTLNQAIKNNTDAGFAGTASGEAYVQSLQKQAAIADDELRPALATLVRSTNDVTEAQKLLGLSADVAAGTGRDVGSVADALAKAYQGNTKSLKALAPEVSKLIKDGASANEIFSKLTEVYAGSAKGLADVSPWQRLNVQVEEAKEQVGTGLLPQVEALGSAFEASKPLIDYWTQAVVLASDAAKSLKAPLQVAADILGSIPGAGKLDGLFNSGGGDDGFGGDKALRKFVEGRDAATKLFDELRSGKIAVGDLVPTFNLLPPALQTAIDKFLGIKPAASSAGDGLAEFAERVKTAQAALSGVNSSLFGISDAQDALSKSVEDSSSATSSAASKAKAYESALRRVDDSTRSLADAQDALQEALIKRFVVQLGASSDDITTAQINERDSTRSLADSKLKLIDAQQALNRLRNGGAAASRLEAQAAFLDAQKAAADASKSGDPSALLKAKAALIKAQAGLDDTSSSKQAANLEKAQRDVEAAQDGVTKAAIDQRSAQKDLNETLIKGKEGSRDLAEANKAVEQAQRQVEDATRNLSDAQSGVQEALANTAGATKTATDRFRDGRSAAQSYIDYLTTHGGTVDDFSKAIGDISTALGGVAREAGKTDELDAYLSKLRETAGLLLSLNNAPNFLPTTVPGQSHYSANSLEQRNNQSLAIQLFLDGKQIGDAVADASVSNGGFPIVIKPR